MTARTHSQQALYRVAVIGGGRICEYHMQYLRQSSLAKPVAICDLSRVMVDFMSERFSIPQAFTDYREMLEVVKPNVVHVLTPPHSHVSIARDCLEKGAHVILEKPIAPTHLEFLDIWQLAQRKKLYLMEDHNYRFNQPILAIERMLAEHMIGEVRDVEVRMNLGIREGGRYADENFPHPSHKMPAGVIHEFLSHLCYLVLLFLPKNDEGQREKIGVVQAAWRNRGEGNLFKYDDLDAMIECGPACARIRFDCHSQPDAFTVTVRGTEGMVHTDLFQPHLLKFVPRKGPAVLTPILNQWINGRALKSAAWGNFRKKLLGETSYEGLTTFLARAYEAIDQQTDQPVSFEDMNETMLLIDALLEKTEFEQATRLVASNADLKTKKPDQ